MFGVIGHLQSSETFGELGWTLAMIERNCSSAGAFLECAVKGIK
jgi:hypothetical protein